MTRAPAVPADGAPPVDGAPSADGAAPAAGVPPVAGGRTGGPGVTGGLRLGLVVGGLVLALLAGFGLGRLDTRPSVPGSGPAGMAAHTHPPGTGPHEHGGPGAATGAQAEVGVAGLSLSGGGLTLVPAATSVPTGRPYELRYVIRGADGRPVTRFAVVHDKPMHLVVVRRDLSGYQHLHPRMAADGTWHIPITLPEPGVWRAYADFTALDPTGRQVPVTLGVDLVAAGGYDPRPLPVPARETAVDGLTVAYQGTPRIGAVQPLLFRVFADGAPVAGLERYLGAYGHLVALREGDLGYLHVHPEPELADGAVKFWLAAPSFGRYRLFFDFQVGGVVRTATFTLVVP